MQVTTPSSSTKEATQESLPPQSPILKTLSSPELINSPSTQEACKRLEMLQLDLGPLVPGSTTQLYGKLTRSSSCPSVGIMQELTPDSRKVETQEWNKLGTSLLALSHTLKILGSQAQHCRTSISDLCLGAMSNTLQDDSTTLSCSTKDPLLQPSEFKLQLPTGKRSRRCSKSLTSAPCTKYSQLELAIPKQDKCTQTTPLDYSCFMEEIRTSGTVSSPKSIPSTPCLTQPLSEGTSSCELTLPLKDCDGTQLTSSLTMDTRSNHYVVTFRPSNILVEQIAELLRKHPNIHTFLIGPLEERGKKDLCPHYHCYIRLRTRQREGNVRSMFPTRIAWMKRIQPNFETTFTYTEAVQAYCKYACKGGKPREIVILTTYERPNKCKEIMEKVEQGFRKSQLEKMYPTMISHVAKMMAHRPCRTHETQCLVWCNAHSNSGQYTTTETQACGSSPTGAVSIGIVKPTEDFQGRS